MPLKSIPQPIKRLLITSIILSGSYLVIYAATLERALGNYMYPVLDPRYLPDLSSLLVLPIIMLFVIANHIALRYTSRYHPLNDLQAGPPEYLFTRSNIAFTAFAGCLLAYHHIAVFTRLPYFKSFYVTLPPPFGWLQFAIGSGEAIVLLALCTFYMKARNRSQGFRENPLQLNAYGTFFDPHRLEF